MRPRLWRGYLMNSGTAAISLAFPGAIARRDSPGAEAHAVIGGDTIMRPIEEVRPAQPPHDPSHQPVRVADLQQMSLEPSRGGNACSVHCSSSRPGCLRAADQVLLAGGQVLPRHVGKGGVEEVEGRAPALRGGSRRAARRRAPCDCGRTLTAPFLRSSPPVRSRIVATAAPEVAERAVDGRQVRAQALGEQQVQRDHTQVGRQRAQPIGRLPHARGRRRGARDRARWPSPAPHRVALAQQGEDAVRVVGGDRQGVAVAARG